MPGKVFLDANILVYAQDNREPVKQQRCRELIAEVANGGLGVISTQVMQEFYVAATRKLGVDPLAARSVLKTFAVFEVVAVTAPLIMDAADCSVLNQLSFWDALILTAAASAGCQTLYSEDLSHGQSIVGVKVINPFAPASGSRAKARGK